MKATLNRYLFTATVFDSGSLNQLTSVIHQFNKPARYRAVVMRHGKRVGETRFEVTESSTAMQLDIDLASAPAKKDRHSDCECHERSASLKTVHPKGYVLFFVSSGPGGHSAIVGEDDDKAKPIFNSESLDSGDLFALSLLEPTHYTMVNRLGSAKGKIAVSFSAKEAKKIKALEAKTIDVTKDRFDPAEVKVTSTQGLVFRISGPARIVIERYAKREPEDKKRPPLRFKKLKLAVK